MNELQIFNSDQFGEIRTFREDDKVLFCGSDVAKALGYKRPNEAIAAHCKGTVKRRTPTSGGVQEMLFIHEGDIYRLAAKSELPSADRFESWIFDEVLPTIRKHGAYMTTSKLEEVMNDPDAWITMLTALKDEREARKALEAKTAADAPKVLFADAVTTSHTSILVGELAKIFKQNGVDMGQNRLFEWLRSNGYLIRRQGTDYNMPTQRSMELGLFEIKETAVTHSDGHTTVSKTPKVTGKGQCYFIARLLGETA